MTGLLLLVLAGCGDALPSAGAAAEQPGDALRLVPIAGTLGNSPRAVLMGDSLGPETRVRVIDSQGRPVAAQPVEFTVVSDGLPTGTAEQSAGAVTVLSDANGLASPSSWRVPVRDSVVHDFAVHARLRASLQGPVTSPVTVSVRAWRDLTRFGGSSPLVLDALPIERQHVEAVLPLGTFRSEDALPSSEALLLVRHGVAPVVRAPTDGLVIGVDSAHGEITLRPRDQVRVRLRGVTMRRDLWVGQVVRRGDVLGTVNARGMEHGLGVRVQDASATDQPVRWIHPERYGARRTARFFAQYLADSLRSSVYGLVRRAAPDLAGRIDYDQDGRLVGTWFDASAPRDAALSASVATSSALLAPEGRSARSAESDPDESLSALAMTFVYDAEHPGQVRIAIGRALAEHAGSHGVFAVGWEDPDPSRVGVAQGLTRYRLYAPGDDARVGRASLDLLVQLLDAATLRVELVPAAGADRTSFSGRALTLVR